MTVTIDPANDPLTWKMISKMYNQTPTEVLTERYRQNRMANAQRYIQNYKRTISQERNPNIKARRKAKYEKALVLLAMNRLKAE